MTTEKEISLGEFLRQERERRGITIEQVASATKVGVKTLHSLEADQFAELPAIPFIRGFVTSYCRFIGLEPKEVLSQFENYIGKKSVERPNREGGHSGYAFEKKDGEQQSRTVLLIAICSFILVGGLAMLFLKPSLKHHHRSHIDKLKAAHTEVNGPSPSPMPSPMAMTSPLPLASPPPIVVAEKTAIPEATASPLPVPSPKPSTEAKKDDPLDSGLSLKPNEVRHKAVIKTLADIWVRYQVDDRAERKFIVRKNKVLVLRAKESIRFQVSNPNAASLSYNGRGSAMISRDKNAILRQGVTTLFFPQELAEKIEKPFKDNAALPETPGPVSDSLSTVSSPSL